MSEDFDDLKKSAKKMAEEATEAAKDKFQNFQESPEWEEIRKVASSFAEEAAEMVKKYPLQSVAGAAAVGFLLSSLFNRKR